ncbi:MAG TPA: regulatory protein RecX [Gemmatimonadota bacterium]|nr:regulatory protein RecX [Gemmatimonadota bacterium]
MTDPAARDAVKAKALDLLARREHSVKELGEKLARRPGADPATVREVVQELAARELVSDARYAAAWARDAVRLDPRAERLVVTELVEKGVPAALAAAAVRGAFEEEDADDRSLARGLAERRMSRLDGLDDAARWRRLAGYLQRRGFANELIYDVCAEILPEPGGTPG